jgi:hypothetical protein
VSAATLDHAGAPILEPGVYTIPEAVYHADPVPGGSLSSTGARKILPPSCPALFRHEQLNGRPEKRQFDFGHAAHSLVLGVGAPLAVVDADDWRTKSAKEQRDAAYAAGHTPILAGEHEQVLGMAAALRDHPIASALFDSERGTAEQSLFWRDDTYEAWLRARLDWLPCASEGRMILGDYKTCISAEPKAIAKSIGNYGYHQQGAWYIDIVKALGLAEEVAFVFVFQEKTAPYLVTVAEPDHTAIRIGRHLNQRALEVYAECVATDTWPSYTDEVERVSLPPWVINQYPELT